MTDQIPGAIETLYTGVMPREILPSISFEGVELESYWLAHIYVTAPKCVSISVRGGRDIALMCMLQRDAGLRAAFLVNGVEFLFTKANYETLLGVDGTEFFLEIAAAVRFSDTGRVVQLERAA